MMLASWDYLICIYMKMNRIILYSNSLISRFWTINDFIILPCFTYLLGYSAIFNQILLYSNAFCYYYYLPNEITYTNYLFIPVFVIAVYESIDSCYQELFIHSLTPSMILSSFILFYSILFYSIQSSPIQSKYSIYLSFLNFSDYSSIT